MFSDNALKVLEKRYFLRDEHGALIEDAQSLFRRVAKAVAAAERKFDQRRSDSEVAVIEQSFYDAMMAQQFMPNSPTLMNAGKTNGQLSACFVLPVPDSLDGIFETCKNAALIHKTGGGTGFSFSRLRPANDRVATSTGVASGPVSFMTVYDAATEAIRQGGTRRGANMGMLRVDHPDIEEFIHCKSDTTRLNNFNISVAATNKFMEAVEGDGTFDLIHPRSRAAVKKVRARHIFDQIVENAHATGEPGLIFIDRINEADPLKEAFDESGKPIPGTEEIEATNPCGEQPLGPGDACNLGSINLAQFTDVEKGTFHWRRLKEIIALAVRFLDNVIEANNYPLPFIADATRSNRRIGVGVMGWAEALIMLGIPYDSAEAVAQAEEVMSFVQSNAHEASQQLAAERGVFPNWKYSTWGEKGIAMRNATVTTIAPTGTISIIAGTSSGIEPIFAVSFVRRVLGGIELVEVNPLFEKMARDRGFYSVDLMRHIAEEGSIAHIDAVPDDVKRVWVCSHDIPYIWHVRMQVAFQKHTDNAVSKTINFPREATIDDVKSAYMAAWQQGLKGITVYRDTSRLSQVLNIAKTDPLKKVSSAEHEGTVTSPRVRRAQADSSVTAGRNPIRLADRPAKLAGAIGNREGTYSIRLRPEALQNANFNSAKGYAADISSIAVCPECRTASRSLARHEACLLCVSCGYTYC